MSNLRDAIGYRAVPVAARRKQRVIDSGCGGDSRRGPYRVEWCFCGAQVLS